MRATRKPEASFDNERTGMPSRIRHPIHHRREKCFIRMIASTFAFCLMASRPIDCMVTPKPRSTSTRTTPTPLQIVTRSITPPSLFPRDGLKRTIQHAPADAWSDTVRYTQKATGAQMVNGREILSWNCGTDLTDLMEHGVSCAVNHPPSQLSPDTILVKWNVTWTPPTAGWIRTLGNAWPGVTAVPRTYNHLSTEISVFRWTSVFRLFSDAVKEGTLTVPLACIEGRSLLRFSESNGEATSDRADTATAKEWKLTSITEELSYADDLRRGALLHRKCAADLRIFLELGRKPPDVPWEDWEYTVKECLPWGDVPGSGVMDVEPTAEDEENFPVFFLGFSFVLLLTFANLLAPELIGQSLF